MKKLSFIFSLFVVFATTALAQETLISSSELNALTSGKKVAVKNLSGTNSYWLALTSSVAEISPEAMLIVEPTGNEAQFYLKRAYETDSYVQAAASGAITLGAQATAQVFTAETPTAPSSETLTGDLNSLVRFVQYGAGTWLNCQNAANSPILGNTGQGGWTMHNVYDMSDYYLLTINEVVAGTTTTTKKIVKTGTAINVEKDGYTHDFTAQNMPAADTEITVNYTAIPTTATIGASSTTLSGSWDWTSAVDWSAPTAGTYDALLTATEGQSIDGATFDSSYVLYTEQQITVTDAGHVTVAFKWTGGNHRMDIIGVDMVKDGSVAYSSYSVGFSGGQGIPVEYRMEDVAAGTYTLRYFSTNQQNNNSKGTITITYSDATITTVSSLAEIKADKCYTVYTTERGGWASNEDGTAFTSTGGTTPDVTNTLHQFAFVTTGSGKYYLWSVSAAAFVLSDMTLSKTACEAVQFNDASSQGTGKVQVQFVGNSNGYINLGSGKQMVVNWYSTVDPGNAVTILEAADFNPAAALTLLYGLEYDALATDLADAKTAAATAIARVGATSTHGTAIQAAVDAAQAAYDAVTKENVTGTDIANIDALIAAIDTAVSNALYITSLDNLSNSKVYTVSNPRGAWYSDGTQLNGTAEKGATYSISDTYQQFAFVKSESGKYYLYAVADGKFVSKSSNGYTTYTEKPVQAVYFQNGERGTDYPWVVTFDDDSQIGISTYYSPDVIAFYNSLSDEGNCVRLEIAGTFDATTALALVEEFESIGVYKNELAALVATAEENVAAIGTSIGYKATTDTDYAATLAAIKEFNNAVDSKSLAEIQAEIETVKAFNATFSVIIPTAGKYYFVKNNSTLWTSAEYGLYGNTAPAPAWKSFNGDNIDFWWLAVATTDGIALKNISTDKYLTGNASLSGTWTLGESANTIEFATRGFTTAGNALMNITLEGYNMHANGHSSGAGTAGSIVSWNGDAGSASVWEIVEADETKLADLYRSTVQAAISELGTLASNYVIGDGLGEYTCDTELKAEIEAFDVDAATYEELVDMMDKINDFRSSLKINEPAVGGYYMFKGYDGGYYINVTATSGNMGMSENAGVGSIFYLAEGNVPVNYYTGTGITGTHSINSDLVATYAEALTFTGGAYPGAYTMLSNFNGSKYLYNHYDKADGAIVNRNSAYADRCNWYIEAVTSLPVTISTAGYSTFYAPVEVSIPEGVEAYITKEQTDNYIVLTQITGVIPAGTAVILKGEAGDYEFAISNTGAAAIEGNLLVGTVAKTLVTKSESVSYYILSVKDGAIGMYEPVNGEDTTTFLNGGHKAYLAIAGAVQSAGLYFGFEGTTGIDSIDVENGTTVIYDLTGRRVSEMNASGIYIVNGKKVLVK